MSDSRIKILHITFNMGIGGTEQVIKQIIENSDAEKFHHEVLCIDGQIGSLGLVLMEHGIPVSKVQRRPGFDIKLVLFIRKKIKEESVQVLHCHQYSPYFYGVLGALYTGAKVIFTEHGRFYPDRHNSKRRFINPLLSLATFEVTAISKATADALTKYEYFKRNKISVIYNGIKDIGNTKYDKEELMNYLDLSSDVRVIGTISRLEPIKNQTMMIKAFRLAKNKIPNLKLVIIGDGAIKDDLVNLSRDLNLENDVIFTGFIEEPQKYISLFEVFLLSSFSEGTSMTLLEAMSLSCPCVVTNVGGNPEIIEDSVTGRITPSDDEILFSEAIVELLFDSEKRKSFGAAARQRFLNEFTATKMNLSYQKVYADLIT